LSRAAWGSPAVADIDPARARSTVDAITQEGHGGNAHAVVGDAAQEEGVDAIFDGALEALGGLDGVVLNVGVGAGLGLRGTTVDHWDRVMATNLRSQFLGCKRAISTMERGSMVLVSSVAAQEVMPVPAYGASKAALESLCRQAAIEGAPAIRVNLLLPGLIDTPLGRRATERTPRRSGVRIPLRRQGSAWEVASAALFLLSDDASYITGQRLVVDGGLTVAPRG
jgi:NAD(P)-dependent dehydrogenase (short-subunit alcohol dehydrogenase family)